MIFLWSLSDTSVLQNLHKYLSRFYFCCNLNSLNFSTTLSLFFSFLRIVPRALTTIFMTVTFIFYSFSALLQGSGAYPAFPLFFFFNLWSVETAKSTIWQVLFFWSGLLDTIMIRFEGCLRDRAINPFLTPFRL